MLVEQLAVRLLVLDALLALGEVRVLVLVVRGRAQQQTLLARLLSRVARARHAVHKAREHELLGHAGDARRDADLEETVVALEVEQVDVQHVLVAAFRGVTADVVLLVLPEEVGLEQRRRQQTGEHARGQVRLSLAGHVLLHFGVTRDGHVHVGDVVAHRVAGLVAPPHRPRPLAVRRRRLHVPEGELGVGGVDAGAEDAATDALERVDLHRLAVLEAEDFAEQRKRLRVDDVDDRDVGVRRRALRGHEEEERLHGVVVVRQTHGLEQLGDPRLVRVELADLILALGDERRQRLLAGAPVLHVVAAADETEPLAVDRVLHQRGLDHTGAEDGLHVRRVGDVGRQSGHVRRLQRELQQLQVDVDVELDLAQLLDHRRVRGLARAVKLLVRHLLLLLELGLGVKLQHVVLLGVVVLALRGLGGRSGGGALCLALFLLLDLGQVREGLRARGQRELGLIALTGHETPVADEELLGVGAQRGVLLGVRRSARAGALVRGGLKTGGGGVLLVAHGAREGGDAHHSVEDAVESALAARAQEARHRPAVLLHQLVDVVLRQRGGARGEAADLERALLVPRVVRGEVHHTGRERHDRARVDSAGAHVAVQHHDVHVDNARQLGQVVDTHVVGLVLGVVEVVDVELLAHAVVLQRVETEPLLGASGNAGFLADALLSLAGLGAAADAGLHRRLELLRHGRRAVYAVVGLGLGLEHVLAVHGGDGDAVGGVARLERGHALALSLGLLAQTGGLGVAHLLLLQQLGRGAGVAEGGDGALDLGVQLAVP